MTTKIFKHLLYTICIALPIVSCIGMLEEDSAHLGSGETFFKTGEGFESAVVGCYASLRLVNSDRATLFMMGTDVISSSAQMPSSLSVYPGINEYGNNLTETNGSVYALWSNLYTGINMCNIALKYGPMVPAQDMDLPQVKKRMAEATFIRSLYYYYLVEQYGDIPYMDTPTGSVVLTAERIAEEAIYTAIIRDMENSIQNLPITEEKWGRVTRGAGYMLLSKLYLTRGYKNYKQPGDFSKAATYADSLIFNMGNKYTLLTGLDGFESLFFYNQGSVLNDSGKFPKRPNNEKNEEMIFSVQYHDQVSGSWFYDEKNYGNYMHGVFSGYTEFIGMNDRSPKYNRHNGPLCETPFAYVLFGFDPSYAQYKEYDYEKNQADRFAYKGNYFTDRRFLASFETVMTTTKAASTKDLINYGGRPGAFNRRTHTMKLNVGDTCVLIGFPGHEISQERIEKVSCAVINPKNWFTATVKLPTKEALTAADSISDFGRARPFIKKFMEEGNYAETEGKRDMNIFRLGEAYLIAAEAYLQSGKTNEALERVNTIRRRAAGNTSLTSPSTMDITLSELDIDFILDERARELYGEELRWLELKRTGKLIERVKRGNPHASFANEIASYHLLRPIPYEWWVRLSNRDEVARNPGY